MQTDVQPAVALEASVAKRAKDFWWMPSIWLLFYLVFDHSWVAAGQRLCLWIGLAYAAVSVIAVIANAGIWLREKVARKVVLPD